MTDPTRPQQTQTQNQPESPYAKPKITIEYCTQCKWMLRAAYFAQELLSTFSTDISEVSLIPRTGGIFAVTLFASSPSTFSSTSTEAEAENDAKEEWGKQAPPVLLWERKRDGGFPEVKELKSRVRNLIDPERSLGHTDRALKKGKGESAQSTSTAPAGAASEAGTGPGTRECEDCK
ncbi:Rdx family-domain-containing protein [Aspergillus oleicola]